MAQLNDQTIASSYEQLLHVNRDGGGDSGNLVTVYDGDNDTTFALQISNAGIKSSGTLEVTGASQLNSTLTVGVDDTGYDVKFFGATSGAYMHWDENIDTLVLGVGSKMVFGSTSATTTLHVESTLAMAASFGKEEDATHYIDVVIGNYQGRYAGITFSQNRSSTQSSTNNFAMVRGKIISADAAASITGSLELLYNSGDTLTVGATITETGNFGIGTGSPSAKLHVVGSTRFGGYMQNVRGSITIASGVADVLSTTGPFVNLQAESSTSDDLTKILIDGATPTNGAELYLVADTGDTITIKTRTHSTVTDESGTISCIGIDADDSAAVTYDEVVLASGYSILHLVYNGRWCVMNPFAVRVNNE